MELESLRGGGGSYFWKGGSRKGGFGRTPRTPSGCGPAYLLINKKHNVVSFIIIWCMFDRICITDIMLHVFFRQERDHGVSENRYSSMPKRYWIPGSQVTYTLFNWYITLSWLIKQIMYSVTQPEAFVNVIISREITWHCVSGHRNGGRRMLQFGVLSSLDRMFSRILVFR